MSEQSPGFEIRPEKPSLFDNLKRIVNDSYFKVNPQRADEFLHRDRS